MLLICAYFPGCLFFFFFNSFVYITRFLPVGPFALALAKQVDGRQLHADTQERAAGRGRGRSHHANHSRLSRCARNQKRNEKKDVRGGREQKVQDLEATSLFFQGFFVVVVDPHQLLSMLAWPWRRTVRRAIGPCEGY